MPQKSMTETIWAKNNPKRLKTNRLNFVKNNKEMIYRKGKECRDKVKNKWLEFLVILYGKIPRYHRKSGKIDGNGARGTRKSA